jgi:hypothetical protein
MVAEVGPAKAPRLVKPQKKKTQLITTSQGQWYIRLHRWIIIALDIEGVLRLLLLQVFVFCVFGGGLSKRARTVAAWKKLRSVHGS